MQKKALLSILILLAAIIISAAIVSLFQPGQGTLVEGVLIKGENPSQDLASFRANQVFLVSPEMHEAVEPVDHEMFNAMALFLQVLEGNKKDTVQVIRVYSQGQLSYCQTNFGDETRQERLEKEACLGYLNEENGALVFIEFPDQSLPKPVIEAGQAKLVVKPNSGENIDTTAFLALRLLFKNSQEIIDRSNLVLGKVSG
jgi:hypothetical protein